MQGAREVGCIVAKLEMQLRRTGQVRIEKKVLGWDVR